MTTGHATLTAQPGRPRPPGRRWGLFVRALIGIVVFGLLVVLGFAGLAGWLYSRAEMSNVGQLSFANRLKIPPLLEPRTDAAGRKVFDLRLQSGRSELLPGKPVQTWGANSAYLGPTLRATRGDRVVINVTNDLPEATTLHWHGMHLPAKADGGPHQTIARARRGRRRGRKIHCDSGLTCTDADDG